MFGQTFRCSARRAGPRYFSVIATQPQASQATSRSAAFTVRRVRAASPAGQSCSSNSRTAQRSEGRSQRRPQTPHDATPGLSSASSASSRRFCYPKPLADSSDRARGRPLRAFIHQLVKLGVSLLNPMSAVVEHHVSRGARGDLKPPAGFVRKSQAWSKPVASALDGAHPAATGRRPPGT